MDFGVFLLQETPGDTGLTWKLRTGGPFVNPAQGMGTGDMEERDTQTATTSSSARFLS